MKRAIIPLLTAALALAGGFPGTALAGSAAPPACQFVFGFKDLHDLIPDQVGACIDDQQPTAEGFAQHTTNGLLNWVQDGNITSFSNGSTTWLNGPFGLQKRGNDQRYTWELTVRAGMSIAARLAEVGPYDGAYLAKIEDGQSAYPGVRDGITTSPTNQVTGPGFTLQLPPYWAYGTRFSVRDQPNFTGSAFDAGVRPGEGWDTYGNEGLIVAGHQPAPSQPTRLLGLFDRTAGIDPYAWSKQAHFQTNAGVSAIAIPSLCAAWYFIPSSNPSSWVWAQYNFPTCLGAGTVSFVQTRLAPPDPLLIIKSIMAMP